MSIHDVPMKPQGECLIGRVTAETIGFMPSRVWNPSPSEQHRTEPYDLPMTIQIGIYPTKETSAKFSPAPFAVIVERDEYKALVAVVAEPGRHCWNQVDFHAQEDGIEVKIDLEGHSNPVEIARHVRTAVIPGQPEETRHALLARGLRQLYPMSVSTSTAPDWWLKPIYCGWGDQVSTSMWLEGPGPEPRCIAYCTQGLYERWLRRLEAGGVPVGTVTIDHGWSPAGSWVPDTIRWPDLKGFIVRQHAAGRRVLLWIATWLWDGLPDQWCVFRDGIKLVADPTNSEYLDYIRRQVAVLLGSDGYDADGFKIDQLSYSPNERHPCGGSRFGDTRFYEPGTRPMRLAGDGWGCELLYRLQKTIYNAAKAAKPDALVTSSTVHPYFHDTFDMVRLHDTGFVKNGDIMSAMKVRADLAHATLPAKPIDTDNWISVDYAGWLKYTSNSRCIGVPCIFFAERFMLNWAAEPTTQLIPMQDLQRIAESWRRS
ncbi:MAG: hypothetical protein NT011_12700 [Kiritimatiellaeota bacterium]|nr:hypothetical protein [Kiritimatiellota bacterium]